MRAVAPFFLLTLAALSGGCGKLADSLPPEGAFRSLHAIPDLDSTVFYVEDRTTTSAASEYLVDTPLFKVATDTYNFRFEVLLPGATSREVALQFDQEIVAGEEYNFVLSGTALAPTLLTWQRTTRSFSGSDILAAGFGHAAQGADPLDIYLDAPGFDPAATLPRAKIAYGALAPDVDLAPGDYQLIITGADNTADRRFVSNAFTLSDSRQVLFAVLDGADIGNAALAVRVIGSPDVALLEDLSAETQLRAAHAALGTGNVDVVIDSQFAPALVTDLAFKQLSAYRPLDSGERAVTITPTGNPGSLLVEDTLNLTSGSRNSLFFVGPPDTLEVTAYGDDGRRLARYGRLRMVNTDATYALLDVYVIPVGEDFTRFSPLFADLPYKAASAYLRVPPDSYELLVTPANSATVLVGPVDLTIAESGIYGYFVVDAVDADTAELVPVDDLAP